MDSTGPSQPSKDEAYTQSNNPISQTSSEKRDSSGYSDDSTVEARERGDIPLPSTHNADPTPSSLGYGARDASGDKPTGDVR